MAVTKTAYRKPTELHRLICAGSPLADDSPDGTTLLNEIDKLFHKDEKSFEKSPKREQFFFSTANLFSKSKLKRRNTFHSLLPSTEWFKLSPKSKIQRNSKRASKLYRNKSDTFLLHDVLCSIKQLPILCHKPSSDNGTNQTLLSSPAAERVQRQLFTPDSGYCSSSECDDRVAARRPKYIIGTSTSSAELDIISEIFRRVPELMPKILVHLSDKELVSFAQVSRGWRDALTLESRYNKKKLMYLEKKRIAFQAEKENIHGMVSRSRGMTQSSVLFGDIQETSVIERLLSSPSSSSAIEQPSSRHEQYWQATKNLRDGEVQMKCHCGSPARINSSTAKATCNKCHYDICTNCKSCYHGNKPCRTSKDVSGSGISTPTSRRNLRRL